MHSAMIRQVLDFNKKAFDDSFNVVVAVQEHTEKMIRDFWGKSAYFPSEGKKVIEDWVSTYKKGLEEFRANVDNRFQLAEDFLLNAACQAESSFGAFARPAGRPAPVEEPVERKAAAVETEKTVSRKPAVKKTGTRRGKKDQPK